VPDFGALERVITGQEKPQRVHQIELLIDKEVMQYISERYLVTPWIPLGDDTIEPYYRQLVNLYWRLGYDCLNVFPIVRNHPQALKRNGQDTAALTKGERRWIEEDVGLIANWQQFEQFPWDAISYDYRPIEVASSCLPDGMKLTVMGTVFQHVVFDLLGTQRTMYLLHDDPDLVAAVFERWGQLVYDVYKTLVEVPEIGAIWHGDDLGFTTSTMVSPQVLRRHVIPWFVKYAKLAHDHGKTFWLHCCGNVYATGIIEDLIRDVRLDAFHSFQDPILPIAEFQRTYGAHLAAMGGVDMDKLCRLDEEPLRAYMRGILDECMPDGRFVFGSGNTIANYIPIDHYLWMLDEGRRWSG
jgi:uroporphyrinogen decarboxylase